MTFSTNIRRTYDAVALFALVNLFGLFGIGAYLIFGGGLDTEKVQRLVAVWRGEGDGDESEDSSDTAQQAESTEAPDAGSTADVVAEAQTNLEIVRREADRLKAELDQRLALNNTILLRVTSEREGFRRERESYAKQQAQTKRDRTAKGFRKQVEIFAKLSPKTAVDHLLSLDDASEAASVLAEMDTRTAKKIIEAAKRPEQTARMKEILRLVRSVSLEVSGDSDGFQP